MDVSLYLAYSGLRTEMRSVDVVANNLANTSTNGYREDRSFVGALEAVDRQYPRLEGTLPSHDPGARIATGRDLDVAVEGDAYLVVETAGGRRYTRDGALGRDPDGTLVNRDGLPIVGDAGPITLPNGKVDVDADGRVSVDGTVVGRVSLVQLDSAVLSREGQGLYRLESGEEVPESDARLHQGFLERSNVDPIRATVELVDAVSVR